MQLIRLYYPCSDSVCFPLQKLWQYQRVSVLRFYYTTSAIIDQIEDAGYTVKYNFYRSTKKSSKYKSMLIKSGKSYTNTKGKKDRMYFYKARVQVYDAEGKLIARTALKDCRYANRLWTKK